MDYEKKIDIPFGAHDSELKGWEFTIPEGMEAIIKDGKVIVREKESEDERIRRQLINVCNDLLNGDYSAKPCLNDIKWLKKLLERQKINTEGDFGRGYDCGYEACLNSHGAEWFEKQKEQSLRDFIDDFPYSDEQAEQKPAEVKDPFSNANFVRGYESGYADAKREQKPAEWSEEDEKIIQSLILAVNKYVFFAGIETNKIVSFLKSLRPSWKPSEEQMEALIDCAIGNEYDVHALVRLWAELKKL